MRTISPLKFESCFIRRLRLCCKVGIMESIPEDLVSLKRNALQKLCKKLGLKANGKNVDMIGAIENLKKMRSAELEEMPQDPLGINSTSDEAPLTNQAPPTPEGEVWATPPTSPKPTANKKRGRKKGRRGRGKAKPKDEEESEECALNGIEPEQDIADVIVTDPCLSITSTAGTTSVPTNITTSSPTPISSPTITSTTTSPIPSITSPSPTTTSPPPTTTSLLNISSSPAPNIIDEPRQTVKLSSSERLTRKRKRSSTYSLSPDRSLLSVAKHPRLNQSEATPTTDVRDEIMDVHKLSETENNEEIGGKPPFSPSHDAKNSETISLRDESPFSPPLSPQDLEEGAPSETSRKRKLTFTVRSDKSSSPHNEMMEKVEDPEECPRAAKRIRYSTNEMISGGGVMGTGSIPPDGMELESESAGDIGEPVESRDMKDELLSLLDQRVEKIQSDPSYRPVHSSATANSMSRIPVKTATARKFDKAHSKTFKKMQSITSCYEARRDSLNEVRKKKKRDSLTSRARASMQANVKSLKPGTTQGQANEEGKINIITSRTTATTTAKGFKPSVVTTKKMSCNFASAKDQTVSLGSAGLKSRNPEFQSLTVPARKIVSAVRTPSKTCLPTGENNPSSSSFSSLSAVKKTNIKRTFDLAASLKKPKPGYKTYTGKLPGVKKN